MSKQKILVVEDDAVLREVLTEKLIKSGYETTYAEDGVQALTMISQNTPDLILLDMLMPKKTGMEVMEELAKDPELHKIPIIVISNSGQPVEVKRAKELGAKDFLIKAVFDPNEVLEKIETVLKNVNTNSSDSPLNAETAGNTVINLDADKTNSTNSVDSSTSNETLDNQVHGHVLVVEDDKFLRELFVRKLVTEGFEVDNAVDAGETFDMLSKKKPDIVLLDLILPGIDGFEILEKMKKDPTLKSIPVIVISNLGQKEDIDRALELGAVDFLVKANFTLDEIISRVLVVLRGG